MKQDSPYPITLYDTYKKQEVVIKPEESVMPGWLTLYSCGPTVYSYQQIGNYYAAWFPDMISRAFSFAEWKVRWVMNITDVGHLVGDGDDGVNVTEAEDKLEKGARRDNKTVQEVVDFYTNDFLLQARRLNIRVPEGELRPFASNYVKQQMMIALELVVRSRAYFLEDGIYFDSQANQDLAVPFTILQEGSNEFTGRDIKNTTKNPADFALWKFVDPASLQQWKFAEFPEAMELVNQIDHDKRPNGVAAVPGCPGWHSECVAMIGVLFGYFQNNNQTVQEKATFSFADFKEKKAIIDVHTGGEDHIDVHHKNEILQSEALGFHLSRFWVHNKFVMVDGKKMSKSVGNVVLPQEIIDKGYDPLAYRMMMLEHHYIQQMDFTWSKLNQSQARLVGLRKDIAQIRAFVEKDEQYVYSRDINPAQKELYINVLADNLNLPLLVEKFQKIVSEVLDKIVREKAFNTDNINLIRALENEILSLDVWRDIPADIIDLAESRAMAKEEKRYQEADEIRAQIQQLNWDIGDFAWGYGIWKVR